MNKLQQLPEKILSFAKIISERRKEEEEELHQLCLKLGSEASLLDIRHVISGFYGEDVILPKKLRALNAYTVFSENKKLINKSIEKLVPEEVIATLTPQNLFQEYKAQNEEEDAHLERLKAEKQAQLGVMVEEDSLQKSKVAYGRTTYLIFELNRKYENEFAGVFGRKTNTKNTALPLVIGEQAHVVFKNKNPKKVTKIVNPGPHKTTLQQNKEQVDIERKLKEMLNEQCSTNFAKMPWKKMVKAGGPSMVYQSGQIVVENWPLDSFSDKLIAKRSLKS
ncbi:hypothetical protein G6F56_002178 [Rhizopus delemar]|nr:hypothetical protein G6F56_002178 [Rhizopus delemar]